MSRWDIEPAGVRGVVRRTQAAANGFVTGGNKYQAGAQQAASNCGSPIVAQALVLFAAHHQDTLPRLMKKTSASLTGAVDATNAYLAGDLEMAERAQHRAATFGTGHTLTSRR